MDETVWNFLFGKEKGNSIEDTRKIVEF